MPVTPSSRKSGQAIIFLMVVMVIGLLVVVWNFDLHRVINAKLRIRHAADSAALAAARWQGHTLNMIGDLNLIQAAILSEAYETYATELAEWEEEQAELEEGEEGTEPPEFEIPPEVYDLHELRDRLVFIGPLTAFAVAQQTALNNGAVHDVELASNLTAQAEDIRYKVARTPYDNAFKDYANLLDLIVENGVAVGSYTVRLPRHRLAQEKFYAAIAQALIDNWCPFYPYRHLLENYDGVESWGKLTREFRYNYMLDLKLDEFAMVLSSQPDTYRIPATAIPSSTNFLSMLDEYLGVDEVIVEHGSPDYPVAAMTNAEDVLWHVYDSSWSKMWPRATYYNEETDEEGGNFPIHSNIKPEFNYMGAEAGFMVSTPVHKGILGSSDSDTVELTYKTKAKAFGYLDVTDPTLPTGGALEPPHYFGFVLPAFEDVRLIHSDIGDKVVEAAFHRHVTGHLDSYLEMGTSALESNCRYCRLLVQWESLDREAGLAWLEEAYSDPENNPCKPDDSDTEHSWGKAGGGATGGS